MKEARTSSDKAQVERNSEVRPSNEANLDTRPPITILVTRTSPSDKGQLTLEVNSLRPDEAAEGILSHVISRLQESDIDNTGHGERLGKLAAQNLESWMSGASLLSVW